MNKTLIIVEPTDQLPMVQSLITAAKEMNRPCDICLFGKASTDIVTQIKTPYVSEIIIVDGKESDLVTAEDACDTLHDTITDYNCVIMAATSFGRSCLPYIASTMDTSPITDIIAIKNPQTFERPMYAGNAIQTIENLQKNSLLTVRIPSFKPSEMGSQTPKIKRLAFKASGYSQVKDQEVVKTERPDLTAAKIVVSGGAGIGSKQNFDLVESLADTLGAAIGASRAAVDAGYVASDNQVGQTGKIIAPEVYIAVGISGAIQHMAGMKDSGTIVAINNDPDAPIFKVADIGYCGDLFDILPKMIESAKNTNK